MIVLIKPDNPGNDANEPLASVQFTFLLDGNNYTNIVPETGGMTYEGKKSESI